MKKSVTKKFDKSVDPGPLPEGLDTETAQTIQDERIRRQVQTSFGKGTAIKAKKARRAKVASIRAGY